MLVATVLTACGIETYLKYTTANGLAVATVLTACGIETKSSINSRQIKSDFVATVLTACGIETLA